MKSRIVRYTRPVAIWTLGVTMPLYTVVFEWLTHQVSGTMFDPMSTPSHALMLLALPVGAGINLISRKPVSDVGLALVGVSLPAYSLIVWAIGADHYVALLKFLFGLLHVAMHPSQWARVMFGDFYISPIAALAYLGPLAAILGILILVTQSTRHRFCRAFVPAFLVGFCGLSFLELRDWTMAREIVDAQRLVDAGGDFVPSNRLMEPTAKRTIARLSCPGRQFSSHGPLYAVGPVNVFGAWTYIRRGRLHPVALLIKTKWPDFRQLHNALWPDEEPKPDSWRGLSPWERQRA